MFLRIFLKTRNSTYTNASYSGFERYILRKKIDIIIDATHPFAVNITRVVVACSQKNNIPFAIFTRPAWHKDFSIKRDTSVKCNRHKNLKNSTYASWKSYKNIDDIVIDLLGSRGNIFIAVGSSHAEKFSLLSSQNPQITVIARMINTTYISGIVPIFARGPFSYKSEVALFKKHNFKALVCKNSGGDSGFNKIRVALKNRIPIYMLERPDINLVNNFSTAQDIFKFLDIS